MAWKRVKHPSELINIGDELQVKVLRFDREKNRVSLGIKQLGEDPWENIARRYPKDTRLHGRITNITDVTPIPHNGCRPPKKRRV